jgi:hypothetical protein
VTIVPETATIGRGPAGERPAIVAGMDGYALSSVAARFAGVLADRLDHRLVVVQLRDRVKSRAGALQAISESEAARMIVIAAEASERGRRRAGRSPAATLPRLARCPVTVVPYGARTTLGDEPHERDVADLRVLEPAPRGDAGQVEAEAVDHPHATGGPEPGAGVA